MPTCQTCGYKWNWKETFKRMFTFKPKLKCPSCKTPQFITRKATQRISFITLFPILMWIPLITFGVSNVFVFALEGVVYLIVFMSIPFLLKLSNEEEPFW